MAANLTTSDVACQVYISYLENVVTTAQNQISIIQNKLNQAVVTRADWQDLPTRPNINICELLFDDCSNLHRENVRLAEAREFLTKYGSNIDELAPAAIVMADEPNSSKPDIYVKEVRDFYANLKCDGPAFLAKHLDLCSFVEQASAIFSREKKRASAGSMVAATWHSFVQTELKMSVSYTDQCRRVHALVQRYPKLRRLQCSFNQFRRIIYSLRLLLSTDRSIATRFE